MGKRRKAAAKTKMVTANRPDHVAKVLSFLDDADKVPVEGLEFSFTSSTTANQTHRNAAELCIQDAQDWELLIQDGLTWKRLVDYTDKRECIQIGPLFLSKTMLSESTFQEILMLGNVDTGQVRVATIGNRKQTSVKIQKGWCNIKKHEAALSGLAKLYTATSTGDSHCYVPESSMMLWVLSFEWGVIFDTIHLYKSLEEISGHASAWIAKHCRHICMHYRTLPIDSFLPQFLINEESNIQGIHSLHIEGKQVDDFSAILRHSRLRVLEIRLTKPKRPGVARLICALCACSSLNKITVHNAYGLPLSDWVAHLTSLIRCSNLQIINFFMLVLWKDIYEVISNETGKSATTRLDNTNAILNEVESNETLARLAFCPGGLPDIHDEFVDDQRIASVMKSRRDKLFAARMCRFMGSNHPLKMAIYGKMICECASGDRGLPLRLRSKLFDVLCQTNQYLMRSNDVLVSW